MRNLNKIFACLILIGVGLSLPGFAFAANTYYVSLTGADSNTGTLSQPFRTVLKGMSVLRMADTLYVRGGTYIDPIDEPIGLDNSTATSWDQAITVKAYQGEQVILNPSSGNRVFTFANKKESYLVLDGFILDGSNVQFDVISITNTSGVYSHHIWVRNSTIQNSPDLGILITGTRASGAGSNIFSNLDVHDNGFKCPTNANMTYAHCHGIYVQSDDNIVEFSKFHDNAGWGVHVYSGDYPIQNDIVRYNLVYNNGTNGVKGDGLGHPGIGLYSGPGHQAYGNIVWGNYFGIILNYGATNALVHDNILYNNNFGNHGDGAPIGDFGVNDNVSNNTIIKQDAPAIMPDIPVVVAASDLVGYWKLNEAAGINPADSSGQGNNGTDVNKPVPTDGVYGNALLFNGVNNYVSVPRTVFLEPSELTVSLWVRFNNLDYVNGTGQLQGFAGKGNVDTLDPSANAGWWFSYDNRNNRSGFNYTAFGNTNGGYGGGGNSFGSSAYNYVFQNGIYYHIAFTLTSTTAKLYINGVPIGPPQTITNLRLTDTTANLTMGSITPSNYFLNGSIDDVRIFNRALADVEIASIYTNIPLPPIFISNIDSFKTVAGSQTVDAQASVAVQGVQFQLDGNNLGASQSSPPYSVSWDTTQTTNGLHSLSAVATLTGGGSAISSPVQVIVYNSPNGNPLAPAPLNFAVNKFIPTYTIVFGGYGTTSWPLSGLAQFDIMVAAPNCSSACISVPKGQNPWGALKNINPSQIILQYGLGAGQYALDQSWTTVPGGWSWIEANHGIGSADEWLVQGQTYGTALESDNGLNERLMDLGNSNWRNMWETTFYGNVFGPNKIFDTQGSDGVFLDNTSFKLTDENHWHAEGLNVDTSGGTCPSGYVFVTPSNAMGGPSSICVKRDQPQKYYVNGMYLDNLWKAYQEEFLNESALSLGSHGLKVSLNFAYLASNLDYWLDLNRLPSPPFAAMEEDAFVNPGGSDGNSFYALNSYWVNLVANLWALRGTKTIVLLNNMGNYPTSGNPGIEWMDSADANGMTGWEALWFSMGSFLLSFDDVTRNAAMSFTVWGYTGSAYFAEFDPNVLHLGNALGPYSVMSNGLYIREFTKGWVVVNPPGHASLTGVAVPSGQAMVYNHSVLQTIPALVSTFNLAPMRSIILLKQGYSLGANTPSLIYGDANGDGVVTIADVEMTAQAAMNLVTLPSTQQKNAEVSSGTESKPTIYDAFLIAEYAAGLISKFPVQP
jgi:hypothetical protein